MSWFIKLFRNEYKLYLLRAPSVGSAGNCLMLWPWPWRITSQFSSEKKNLVYCSSWASSLGGLTLPSEAQHLRLEDHIPSFCYQEAPRKSVSWLSNHPVQEAKTMSMNCGVTIFLENKPLLIVNLEPVAQQVVSPPEKVAMCHGATESNAAGFMLRNIFFLKQLWVSHTHTHKCPLVSHFSWVIRLVAFWNLIRLQKAIVIEWGVWLGFFLSSVCFSNLFWGAGGPVLVPHRKICFSLTVMCHVAELFYEQKSTLLLYQCVRRNDSVAMASSIYGRLDWLAPAASKIPCFSRRGCEWLRWERLSIYLSSNMLPF